MTPEQERNYWILEGYPLMPEWIEFCREYNTRRVPDVSISVSKWWGHVAAYYAVPITQRAYFNLAPGDDLEFVIEGVATYKWRIDHAE